MLPPSRTVASVSIKIYTHNNILLNCCVFNNILLYSLLLWGRLCACRCISRHLYPCSVCDVCGAYGVYNVCHTSCGACNVCHTSCSACNACHTSCSVCGVYRRNTGGAWSDSSVSDISRRCCEHILCRSNLSDGRSNTIRRNVSIDWARECLLAACCGIAIQRRRCRDSC